MKKIILATGNPGKVKEIQPLVEHLGLQIEAQSAYHVESVEETGLTFVENAILKARHAASKTGLPALADDSGLCVDAINGQPGIISARYAGGSATDEENNLKLIHTLAAIKEHSPQIIFHASFYCALIYLPYADCPSPEIFQGVWHGEIILTPRGEEGFGYDPYFYVPKLGKTAAQLTVEEKNRVSHRGIALQSLKHYFQNLSPSTI
ncbi:RdgB/HAM1 family non-canonical purine NTP pyrophosphatase [Thorsellia kenyensis]|uniref:dITP/XTP pyrophosphatase n=1 Tax=Thorsellia kenyensis TaxID=1549888 RepID=A0ABV6CCZ4_9GAMM